MSQWLAFPCSCAEKESLDDAMIARCVLTIWMLRAFCPCPWAVSAGINEAEFPRSDLAPKVIAPTLANVAYCSHNINVGGIRSPVPENVVAAFWNQAYLRHHLPSPSSGGKSSSSKLSS